ncbi:hypothetical protein A2331_04815 [Candidatus Falkowbacteria bacterium RIFOXYB2_FULL_34_18]|uniref:Uncharacterized protein n=1 Tax=Candidatus Falkowbacteria bacterium RIFOXYD2_FULL_34_120 TaxID=1798007 RepID=A0A1F5TNY8_9BACT|nr:MAG: hypothetical protein A2331_04815 [Candidatus Falkowbacteria bacterium RIFOXYB2_FULL_34_18]OGF28858.1 MAG: hypothetical protein A2500_00560 [Candidatus Falkowbacteria bacterium RIFOXYC12_FULL_34_55]OGF35769.1 MAG: hypothetical protein A2466_04510 [Candidatus Falkowbacteria bacterium RIFOXYC2_FULL_34_220]OGF38435.1 MAG: hypothetical protein A2515_01950 [Candidatus Falkowbacteria bacterium RIFOXYD12_FULL_34_57]OGF40509.1 MAG: hypothetical protein A2531_02975 [Candidatus Falkowbacteria bact
MTTEKSFTIKMEVERNFGIKVLLKLAKRAIQSRYPESTIEYTDEEIRFTGISKDELCELINSTIETGNIKLKLR